MPRYRSSHFRTPVLGLPAHDQAHLLWSRYDLKVKRTRGALRNGDYHVNHPTWVHLMDKDGRHIWFNHRAPNAAAELRTYL
jgi:hypothetical protein